VGKLTINFARMGDNMFMSSESTSTLSDLSTAFDTSVTGLVKSFPAAIVTSRQSVDFVSASGRTLPAKTFSFVNADIYGEGILVASGPHLISVVGIDMSKAPSNTSGTRLAVKKFVPSLKIEK
jgi:hypothetical protein